MCAIKGAPVVPKAGVRCSFGGARPNSPPTDGGGGDAADAYLTSGKFLAFCFHFRPPEQLSHYYVLGRGVGATCLTYY